MKNIILCGFMGSGKTALGRMLSERKKLRFFDTDEIIVEKMRMPIADIFAKYGEEHFRSLETETIKEFAGSENCVISLGGGLAANERNHPYLKEAGIIVLLECNIEETLRRISGDKTRPLTTDGSEDIIKRYNFRKPIYETVADAVVDSSGTAEETYKKLLSALEELK